METDHSRRAFQTGQHNPKKTPAELRIVKMNICLSLGQAGWLLVGNGTLPTGLPSSIWVCLAPASQALICSDPPRNF